MADLFGLADPRSAVLSACGLYRYQLGRVWDPDQPRAYWIMLNPSTACDNQDILDHAGGRGPHARGCHLLDMLLDHHLSAVPTITLTRERS